MEVHPAAQKAAASAFASPDCWRRSFASIAGSSPWLWRRCCFWQISLCCQRICLRLRMSLASRARKEMRCLGGL